MECKWAMDSFEYIGLGCGWAGNGVGTHIDGM